MLTLQSLNFASQVRGVMVDVLAEVNVETPGEQVAAAEALKAVIPANPDTAISRESLVRHLHNPHFLDFNSF